MSHASDPNAAGASGQAADADTVDGPLDWSNGERVAKALARAGVASRREVERLIAAGRVSLNGVVLDTPAVKVGPSDVLTVDGRPVAAPEAARIWRYHKPAGLVTSHRDPAGRPTVFDHLPKDLPRVISVGRLDLNSEGLLLLTNDGELARALELPSNYLVRRYRARARGRATQAQLDRLKDGITVEGVHYGPIDARLEDTRGSGVNQWITVTLSEGKNREVRKVLDALDLNVNRLIRLAYGPFDLGTLAPGEVQEVEPRSVRERLGKFIARQGQPADGGAKPRVMRAKSTEIDAPEAEPRPKMDYKAGWAKPKSRARPPRAAPKPRRNSVKPGAPKPGRPKPA